MINYYLSASQLIFMIGLVHSILGEYLIFRHFRNKQKYQKAEYSFLGKRHVGILWASWHIVTIFGWGFGWILFQLSIEQVTSNIDLVFKMSLMIVMFTSALLVLIGTKAKHPGWVGLFVVSLLVYFG